MFLFTKYIILNVHYRSANYSPYREIKFSWETLKNLRLNSIFSESYNNMIVYFLMEAIESGRGVVLAFVF